MKPTCISVLSAILIIVAAASSFAQGGVVCLYADPDGNTCSLSDTAPGVLPVYAIHVPTAGVTAVQFAAPRPACMVGATWLGDTAVYPVTLGSSQFGVSIGYGTCTTSPVHVLTINYSVIGSTLPDCAYNVVPDQTKQYIEAVDCNTNKILATGGTTYVNSSLACQCDEVPIPPVLEVTPASLTIGGSQTTAQLGLDNTGGGTLTWSLNSAQTWMSFSPASGSGPATVMVNVDRTGLTAGTYFGTIVIGSNGGTAQVPVTMYVGGSGPVLNVIPTQLNFSTTFTSLPLYISNVGSGTLSWNITESETWLSVSPTTGSGNRTVNVTVSRTGLSPGPYTGQIAVNSNGGNILVTVNMTVPDPSPQLRVSPTSLTFHTGTDVLDLGVFNDGQADLNWVITSSETWLTVDPSSGTNSATVAVHVDRTGFPNGTQYGQLSVTSNGGNVTVNVSMEVVNDPVLGVTPTLLTFTPDVTVRTFDIRNDGGGTLQWNLSTPDAWITIDPPLSGTDDATATVRVDTSLVPGGGIQLGTVSVTSNGGNIEVAVRYEPDQQPPPPGLGFIGLYNGPTGFDCNISDAAPGLLSIYVVHQGMNGATASQFAAPMPSCMNAVYLADDSPFGVVLGDSQNGVAIGYGACLPSPIHVLTIQFFGQGLSSNCCIYRVVRDPNTNANGPVVVDCQQNVTTANGGVAIVNPAPSCPCGLVTTHEMTWGHIKSLYDGDSGSEK